jgi:magnesium transporter
MTEAAETQTTSSRLELLTQALDRGAAGSISQMLASLHAGEIGDLLESFPQGPREILWELVEPHDRGEVLLEVNDEVRAGLIGMMENEQLVAAAEGLDTDWRWCCTTRRTRPAV